MAKKSKLQSQANKLTQKVLEIKKLLTDEELTFCETHLKNSSSPYGSISPQETYINNINEEILNNNLVGEYLVLRQEQIKTIFVNENAIVLHLLDIYHKCMLKQPIIDNKGHHTGEYKVDSKGANDALKMISTLISGAKETVNTINVNNPAPELNISDKDLQKFFKKFNDQY